jgi:hypothetical protein
MFDNITSISLIRAGQLCALSVSLPTEALPGVPLISDFLTGWCRRMPGEDRAETERRHPSGAGQSRLSNAAQDMGNTALPDTPADFGD